MTRRVAAPLGRPLLNCSIRQKGGCLFEVLTEFEGLFGGASRGTDQKNCSVFEAALNVLRDTMGL